MGGVSFARRRSGSRRRGWMRHFVVSTALFVGVLAAGSMTPAIASETLTTEEPGGQVPEDTGQPASPDIPSSPGRPGDDDVSTQAWYGTNCEIITATNGGWQAEGCAIVNQHDAYYWRLQGLGRVTALDQWGTDGWVWIEYVYFYKDGELVRANAEYKKNQTFVDSSTNWYNNPACTQYWWTELKWGLTVTGTSDYPYDYTFSNVVAG